MALRQPESMEELVYFTNRDVGSGSARVWVFKKECPKCGRAKMGKPLKPDGKPKMRAEEYACPACGHAVEKAEYEDTLTACAEITCPECGKDAELEAPFMRKNVEGVKTLRLICPHCSTKVDVTKKMKAIKRKGKAAPAKDAGEDEDSGPGEEE